MSPPRISWTAPLRGGVVAIGGFHSPELRRLAAEARRAAGSRWAAIKPKRATKAVLWNGRPFYWTRKGYYRAGRGDRRPLQQLIWEAHHGKKIPPLHEIFFRDRDRHNFSIANLELLSKADLHRRTIELGEVRQPTHETRCLGRQRMLTRKARACVALLLQNHQSPKETQNEALKFLSARHLKIYNGPNRTRVPAG